MARTPLLRVLLALQLLSGCVTAHVTDARLFQPGRCPGEGAWPASAEGYELARAAIPAADSTELEGLVLLHPDPRAVVVYFGGNSLRHCPETLQGATGRAFIKGMAAQRVSLVLVNYRGYGQSEGRPSIELAKGDAVAVVDFARAHSRLRGLPLLVYGQSVGSVLATHVALNRPVRGVVLESPPTTIRAVIGQAMPWYLKPFVRVRIAPELGREDHRELARALVAPVLLTVGTDDGLTPPKMAQEIERSIPSVVKRLVVVPGGRHGDLVLRPEFWTAVGAFLSARLGPP